MSSLRSFLRGLVTPIKAAHFDDPKIIAEVSKGLGEPMRGIALEAIPQAERLAVRGW